MTNPDPGVARHLAAQQVTVVIMESTSDYWRPFYYVLEADFEVAAVNAREVKNVPGRNRMCPTLLGWRIWAPMVWLRASFVPAGTDSGSCGT